MASQKDNGLSYSFQKDILLQSRDKWIFPIIPEGFNISNKILFFLAIDLPFDWFPVFLTMFPGY